MFIISYLVSACLVRFFFFFTSHSSSTSFVYSFPSTRLCCYLFHKLVFLFPAYPSDPLPFGRYLSRNYSNSIFPSSTYTFDVSLFKQPFYKHSMMMPCDTAGSRKHQNRTSLFDTSFPSNAPANYRSSPSSSTSPEKNSYKIISDTTMPLSRNSHGRLCDLLTTPIPIIPPPLFAASLPSFSISALDLLQEIRDQLSSYQITLHRCCLEGSAASMCALDHALTQTREDNSDEVSGVEIGRYKLEGERENRQMKEFITRAELKCSEDQ